MLVEDAQLQLIESASEGLDSALTHWAVAVVANGLGQYDRAYGAAERAARHRQEPAFSIRSLAELVEAASRLGRTDRAAAALERLSRAARATGTDWALGIEARSTALLSRGLVAERHYREAVRRLALAGPGVERARAHLLYGEWLRREGRRVAAREQLRTAQRMFAELGVAAFAERAGRELRVTGETLRGRGAAPALTPQEAEIARLAGTGRTNPEIAVELHLSPRTVEWHLRKVFTKLGVTSRRELRRTPADAAGRWPAVRPLDPDPGLPLAR